jgi:glycosyltransferase involved in cell wall biosynthesis
MPSDEKILLIIPAHNEQGTIASVVADAISIKKQGAIAGFIVVENGSHDNTAQLAREAGAEVISFSASEKPGKGEAFLQGILYSKNQGASIVIMADADLQGHITKAHVGNMVNPLRESSQLERVIHPSKCGKADVDWRYSGHYSLRMAAFDFLFETNGSEKFAFSASDEARDFCGMVSGSGLEIGLFYAIDTNKKTLKLFSGAGAIACSPFHAGKAKEEQDRQIDAAMVNGIAFRNKYRTQARAALGMKEASKGKTVVRLH